MARKRKAFDVSIPDAVAEDIRLPSLARTPPRVEGYAYRFKLVLPLLSETGEEVFTIAHVRVLVELFDRRCGGCLASADLAHPAWHGSYLPEAGAESVKDYHSILYVYTRQIDAADRFFQLLKDVLKSAALQPQEEILIERVPVWLVESAAGR